MLDEEMDHMIRQAAENHHPPYNDKAWEKMELQLDKHLPQKKDRKKLIFFLLFFLLLGGGLFFAANRFLTNKETLAEKKPGNTTVQPTAGTVSSNQPGTVTNAPLTVENENGADDVSLNPDADDQSTGEQTGGNKIASFSPTDNKTVIAPGKQDNTGNNITNKKFNRLGKGKIKVNIVAAIPVEEPAVTKNVQTNKKRPVTGKDNTASNKRSGKGGKEKVNIAADPAEEIAAIENAPTNKKKPVAGKTADKLNVVVTAADPVEDPEKESNALDENKETTKVEVKIKEESKEEAKAKNDEKKKELTVAENKSKDNPQSPAEKKTGKKFTSNFGLTFSAGPDASFVSLKRLGKISVTYGAGLSYDLSKRFTVRAGFYSTRKKYSALPEQYHTPGGNYPHLVDVDADCKIYEIPVSLSYNFAQKKKHTWFGNVGLSSFIMKNEEYTYNYKYNNQSYSYYKEVSNENKHYFSVLTISGGYKYQLGKRVALQAEPYFQLPLGGVGFGKVKLNSAGVLFTVTVKPFAKK